MIATAEIADILGNCFPQWQVAPTVRNVDCATSQRILVCFDHMPGRIENRVTPAKATEAV